MMKTILFYGDSNTWGFNPEDGSRYAHEEIWTTVCARALGDGFLCIPAGMNGRTTLFDDPWKGCRNGADGLDYELQSHKPLDLCVIMLGTNDLKFTDAQGSARGMEHLIRMVLTANERYALSSPVFPEGPKVLLISPVRIRGDIGNPWDTAISPAHGPLLRPGRQTALTDEEESGRLSQLYQEIAGRLQVEYLDAAETAEPSPIDGVHLGRDGHRAIGMAVSKKIREILS